MAQCRYCGKSGFLLAVDNMNSLCGSCQKLIYSQVTRAMEIIKESEKLVAESKNYKTRLTRCDTIIHTVRRFSEFEQRGIRGLFSKSIQECVEEVEIQKEGIIKDAVHEVYEDARAKVELASSVKAKVTACNNTILKLCDMTKTFGSRPDIDRITKELRKYTYSLEYSGFINAAQKAEAKESFAKALDQYQEALLLLKNDNIDDSQQQLPIVSLERKIDELKQKVEASRSGKKGKG